MFNWKVKQWRMADESLSRAALLVLAAVSAAGCGGAELEAQAELGQVEQALTLANGSFEGGPALNSHGFATVFAGSTALTGWSVFNNGVDVMGPSFAQPASGSRALDMNAAGRGSIRQTLSTVAGATYTVYFSLAGNPTCDLGVKYLRVQAGSSTWDYAFDTSCQTPTNMGWRQEYFTFTATSSSTDLTLSSLVDGHCGPAIDNVYVQ